MIISNKKKVFTIVILLFFLAATLWASGNGESESSSKSEYRAPEVDTNINTATIQTGVTSTAPEPVIELSAVLRRTLKLDDRTLTADEKAKNCYFWALDAYEDGNVIGASAALLEAVDLLGGGNIRIQPLLVKGLFAAKHYPLAKEEYQSYIAMNPDRSLREFKEIADIGKKIDAALAAEDRLYRSARNRTDRERYLAQYPFGRYRGEIRKTLAAKDDAEFAKAVNQNTSKSFESYLSSYPQGAHVAEATGMVAKLRDDEVFAQAVRTGTTRGFDIYLANFPRGLHRTEANSVKEKLDSDAFALAQRTATPEAYKNYLDRFPAGRFVNQAESMIDELFYARYIVEGDRTLKSGNYNSAVANYNKALRYKPGDSYAKDQIERGLLAMEEDRMFISFSLKGLNVLEPSFPGYDNPVEHFVGGLEFQAGIGKRVAVGTGGMAVGGTAIFGAGWLFFDEVHYMSDHHVYGIKLESSTLAVSTLPMIGVSAFVETPWLTVNFEYRIMYGWMHYDPELPYFIDPKPVDSYIAYSPAVRIILPFGLTFGMEWRNNDYTVDDQFALNIAEYGFGFDNPTVIVGYTFVSSDETLNY